MSYYGVLALALLSIWLGGNLLLRPEKYKGQMKVFEHDFSRWPGWAIRLSGVLVIAVALWVLHLAWIAPPKTWDG